MTERVQAEAGVSAFLVGSGQISQKPDEENPWTAPEPAELIMGAASRALSDTGVPDIAARVDAIACVEPFAWAYESLTERVGSELGLRGGLREFWVPIGGNSPQDLLHDVCAAIAEGEVDCVLIAGAEAMYSRHRSLREGKDLGWPGQPTDAGILRGQKPFSSPIEDRHGMSLPIQAFPMFENSIRADRGRTHAEQNELAARLLARNAAVAADNPYAWFRDAPTAEAIGEVTADNRMICYPYTKRMNAIMNVDQGAAIVVMSSRLVEELGLADRAAAVLGGAGAEDIWYLSERKTFSRSLAMDAAVSAAMDHAGLQADEIDAFDLYSCFPSAIEFAASALGIPDEDPRPFSLTGGLAFAGGPGNAYVLNSLAAALHTLREGRARRVLVTGVGMACAKLAATALARADSIPPDASGRTPKRVAFDETPAVMADEAEGRGRIETYTVEYDRDGQPSRVIAIVALEDGRRTLANAAGDTAAVARRLTQTEGIGAVGLVTHDDESNSNRIALD